MQSLPYQYRFYFDVRLLTLKPEDEAKGIIRGADIFSKNKLKWETMKEIENNALMKRQLVHLTAKKEFFSTLF